MNDTQHLPTLKVDKYKTQQVKFRTRMFQT